MKDIHRLDIFEVYFLDFKDGEVIVQEMVKLFLSIEVMGKHASYPKLIQIKNDVSL